MDGRSNHPSDAPHKSALIRQEPPTTGFSRRRQISSNVLVRPIDAWEFAEESDEMVSIRLSRLAKHEWYQSWRGGPRLVLRRDLATPLSLSIALSLRYAR